MRVVATALGLLLAAVVLVASGCGTTTVTTQPTPAATVTATPTQAAPAAAPATPQPSAAPVSTIDPAVKRAVVYLDRARVHVKAAWNTNSQALSAARLRAAWVPYSAAIVILPKTGKGGALAAAYAVALGKAIVCSQTADRALAAGNMAAFVGTSQKALNLVDLADRMRDKYESYAAK